MVVLHASEAPSVTPWPMNKAVGLGRLPCLAPNACVLKPYLSQRILCWLAAGHAAARPCHNTEGQARDDLRQAMTFGLSSEALPPLEVAYHGDCTSTCDNEDTPKELEIECWGSFLLVCKGNSRYALLTVPYCHFAIALLGVI